MGFYLVRNDRKLRVRRRRVRNDPKLRPVYLVTQDIPGHCREDFLCCTLKGPGIFILICDCVGPTGNKYRLTRSMLRHRTFDYSSWPTKQRTVRKNNGKNVTIYKEVNVKNQNGAARSKKRGRRQRGGGTGMQMQPYLLGRVNPFLSSALGAKSPDSFNYPSATGVLRASLAMTSNATGYTAQAFFPDNNTLSYVPLSYTAGTVVWTGGYSVPSGSTAAYQAVATVGRTVNWGLRITTDTALTASSGHIWVAHVPLNAATLYPSWGFPTTEAQIASMPLAEKFSLVELAERPLIVPGRAFDDGIYRFRDVNGTHVSTSNALESTYGWSAIVIYAAGLPASTNNVLNVEHINHVEYIQNGGALYGFVDALPSPYNPTLIEQAALLERAVPTALLETEISTDRKVEEVVIDYATRAVNFAGKAVPIMMSAKRIFSSMQGRGSTSNVPRLRN